MQLHFSDYAYYSLLDVILHLINKGPSRTQLLRQLYMCPEHKKRCWGRGAQGGEESAGILLLTSCHADQSSNETRSNGRIAPLVSILIPSGHFVTHQKHCKTEHQSTWCVVQSQRSLWFGITGFRRLWFRWTGAAVCKKLTAIMFYSCSVLSDSYFLVPLKWFFKIL